VASQKGSTGIKGSQVFDTLSQKKEKNLNMFLTSPKPKVVRKFASFTSLFSKLYIMWIPGYRLTKAPLVTSTTLTVTQ